jgi:hypothetical protein
MESKPTSRPLRRVRPQIEASPSTLLEGSLAAPYRNSDPPDRPRSGSLVQGLASCGVMRSGDDILRGYAFTVLLSHEILVVGLRALVRCPMSRIESRTAM